jgi:acetoin utilization deacetylase AcuC-like enzyme
LCVCGCWRCHLLASDARILVIDLDAHRGNGIEDIFHSDPDESEAPFMLPLKSGSGDRRYLETLTAKLPEFLECYPDAQLLFIMRARIFWVAIRWGTWM